MQIQPDVHWIEGQSSNLYLCRDEDGLALIDAGMPSDQKRVFALLEELGYPPTTLTRIVITHADIDHAGSAGVLQAKSGAKVYAGPDTADLLRRGKSPEHMPRLIQWFINAFIKYRPVPAEALVVCQDGDELPVLGGLQALATPGHTPDHFSFYNPAGGVLFAGDALNTREDRLQRTPSRITADEEAADRSAIRLLELAPAIFACGHGTPLSSHQAGDLMNLFNELRSGKEKGK